MGLLTLGENVRFIGLTVEAVAIPVIADADTGYGNALNVIRTVREYEKAGVAAFHLEDQVSPKKCGHYDGKEVISRAEMIGKIKAAVDTRRDADMVIIARSDARAIEGLEAAIDRVNAYLEAGADVGFVEAPQTIEELRIVGRRVKGPALVNVFEGGKTPMLGASELEGMGFRLGIYPSQTHRAAIRAAQRVLLALKEDGHTTRVEPTSPPSRNARTRSAPRGGAGWKTSTCGSRRVEGGLSTGPAPPYAAAGSRGLDAPR